jgi:hypothetical protein
MNRSRKGWLRFNKIRQNDYKVYFDDFIWFIEAYAAGVTTRIDGCYTPEKVKVGGL